MRTGISKLFTIGCLLLAGTLLSFGQPATAPDDRYERVSLCQFMVTYPHKVYCRELEHEYESLPFPNRFNNHNLGVNFIQFPSDKDSPRSLIDNFLTDAGVGQKCVSKWFGRSKKNGGRFSTDLLKERGHYNATLSEAAIARSMVRGAAWLADGGERLLGYTFVVVHDPVPLDAELKQNHIGFNKTRKTSGGEIHLNDSIERAEYNRQFHAGEHKRSSYEVKCNSYLYRLKWNDEIAAKFYTTYYSENPDDALRAAYDADRNLFRLEYVGVISNTLNQKRERRIKSNEQLVKTALARVIDLNLAQLQIACPDFRVKSTLVVGDDGKLTSQIGLKEDVSPDTMFEVLERVEDSEGRLSYERVGLVRPVKGQIWDNRFNAYDIADGRDDAGLNATTFEPVGSLSDPYSGLILRQLPK